MSVTFNRKGVMRMKKGFFIVFLLVLFPLFCFSQESIKINKDDYKSISVDRINANPTEYLGKKIAITKCSIGKISDGIATIEGKNSNMYGLISGKVLEWWLDYQEEDPKARLRYIIIYGVGVQEWGDSVQVKIEKIEFF